MHGSLLVVLSIAATSLALGCAGEMVDAPAEPSDSAEDALTSSDLPNVTAIAFETTRRQTIASPPMTTKGPTIALGSKVTKVMRAIKARGPSTPIPACGGFSPRTSMRFLNEKGDEIAAGSYSCSIGSVVLKGGREISIFVQSSNITSVTAMPLVPADVLYGIDEVEITRRGADPAHVKTKAAEAIGSVVAALDLDTPPKEQHVFPHCLPSHTVAFHRKGKTVGAASYTCDVDGPLPAKLAVSFSAANPDDPEAAPLLAGLVDFDPRVAERLLP